MTFGLRQKGFTLLEVMIALAILSIAMIAAMISISSHIKNQVYMKDRTFAHWVAMNSVAELRAKDEWPDSGELAGNSDMGARNYVWTIKVTAFEGSALRRLDVEVKAEDEPEQILSTLIAFVGKPT